MLATTDYSTDGKFTISNQRDEQSQNQAFKAIDGKLTLNNTGKTTFSIHLTPKPEQPLATQTMSRSEMIANLFAKSDCNTCHNQDVKTVGYRTKPSLNVTKTMSKTAIRLLPR
jgi:cytochrome c